MTKNVCVVDPICFEPYDDRSLEEGALAGTEATVVHVARALGWTVLQHNRLTPSGSFLPFTESTDPQTLIVLRDPVTALDWAKRYPRSRIYLWLHDLIPLGSSRARVLTSLLPELARLDLAFVVVSDFLRSQLLQVLIAAGFGGLRVERIYNPVVIPRLSSGTIDPNQLIFFSSPHKGLATAVNVFNGLRRRFRSLNLLIANPGYFPSAVIAQAGIRTLGSLPKAQVLHHVQSSLCTLFPNYVYAETFGLVLAESNAVGTPVITHAIGAAPEILGDERQLIRIPRGRMRLDALQHKIPGLRRVSESIYARLGAYDDFIERLESWRSGGRPSVGLRPEFSLERITAQWSTFIGVSNPVSRAVRT